MRKLMLTLGLFAALGVCAQETIKTTANKFNGYGIVYSLPRTALDIEVTVTRSVEKAGPFAKYAQKYLGTAPIANTDRSVWKIDGIKVNPIGKADPDKQFAIQLKGENSTSFYLDSEGILVAINEQPKKISTHWQTNHTNQTMPQNTLSTNRIMPNFIPRKCSLQDQPPKWPNRQPNRYIFSVNIGSTYSPEIPMKFHKNVLLKFYSTK